MSITCLASAFSLPKPENFEAQGVYKEVETKSEIEKVMISVRPTSPLLSVLSFPHYLNLKAQLEVLEFLKPPLF